MANSFIGRTDLPIGIRNNNPGNIRPGDAWQGAIGTDGGFIVFQDVSWGLRALATDLANKITVDGLTTITAIVSVYAPPSENDTQSYINAVSADTGIDPNAQLSLDTGTLHSLMRAIINHENGDVPSQLISDADIDQGISMMSGNLQQLFTAATIAVQNPTTPGGLLVIGGLALMYLIFKN